MKRMKDNQPKEKRLRNVAHLWVDKQTIRYFRKNYLKAYYKNFRSIYVALCEMDSDFGERKRIRGFTKTVSTYAGMGEATTRKYLKALCELDLIDYEQENIEGRFGETTLSIYKWEEPTEEQKEIALEVITGKYRPRKTPSTVKPVNGKQTPYKNTTSVVSTSKNPKGSTDTPISPQGEIDEPSSNRKSDKNARYLTELFHKKYYKPLNDIKTVSSGRYFADVSIMYDLLYAENIHRFRIRKIITQLSLYASGKEGPPEYLPQVNSLNEFRHKFLQLERFLNNDKQVTSSTPLQTPKQIIEQEFSVSMEHMITQDCFNPALSLITNTDNGAESELAQNMVDFAHWFKKKQQRPDWRDLDPKNDHELATRCKWEDEIPDAWGFMGKYVEWLADQTWLDEITPAIFTPGNGVVQKFIQYHQKRIGLNIFTGERRP